jgi:hypothetical protein
MNVTFYVSNKDQEIIEKAKRQQDSLSKVIAAALRLYLDQREEKDERSSG